MNIPDGLKYTASHEWSRAEADGIWTVGITDHAQEALGDVVSIELPEVGRIVSTGEAVAVIESVKAASDIHTPLAGEIVEANTRVTGEPDAINSAPYEHWLFRVKPASGAIGDHLLTPAEYGKAIDQ